MACPTWNDSMSPVLKHLYFGWWCIIKKLSDNSISLWCNHDEKITCSVVLITHLNGGEARKETFWAARACKMALLMMKRCLSDIKVYFNSLTIYKGNRLTRIAICGNSLFYYLGRLWWRRPIMSLRNEENVDCLSLGNFKSGILLKSSWFVVCVNNLKYPICGWVTIRPYHIYNIASQLLIIIIHHNLILAQCFLLDWCK